MNDAELLRRYAEEGSQEAFAELVRLRIGLVYEAALRQMSGDTHRAQDVTQAVFTALARNAASLCRHNALIGWLYTSTRYTATKMARSEQRRRNREQEAHTMNEEFTAPLPEIQAERLRPLLDEVMHQLSEPDRRALLLRFFDGCSMAELGRYLGLSESTAKKRVERALGKLKTHLAKRGLISTAAAVGAALGQEAAAANVPAGLAATISGGALAAASTAAPAISLLSFMTASKFAAIIGAASILGLVSIGTGIYEWQKSLRAQAAREIAALTQERDSLAERLATEQRENKQLQVRVAAPNNPGQRTAGAPNDQFALRNYQALMRDSTYRKIEATIARGELDERYASLFKALGLSTDKLVEFKNLLVEKQMAATDATAVAREQGVTEGMDPRGFTRAVLDAVGLVDNEIKTALGDTAYSQYQQYNQTQPERDVANQLQKSLSYTPTPLTDDQANQFIEILKQAAPPQFNTDPGRTLLLGANGLTTFITPIYSVTDQTLGVAQTVLSPNQTQALLLIQSQQQAQQQMRQMLRMPGDGRVR